MADSLKEITFLPLFGFTCSIFSFECAIVSGVDVDDIGLEINFEIDVLSVVAVLLVVALELETDADPNEETRPKRSKGSLLAPLKKTEDNFVLGIS
jgi:hypothetical protein